MSELTRAEKPGAKRLVLGFDAGCFTCSDLAGRIEERVRGKLEILSLRDPEVQRWRKQALSKDAPWAPTLFKVEGNSVRAWVGWKMGWALSRTVGPAATWQVMQVLGEVGAAPRLEDAALVDKLPGRTAEAVASISRGQFLRGVGGVAVATAILSNGALFPSVAEAATNPATSTGTLAQQNLAKSLVRNSSQFKRLSERQQTRTGAAFSWNHAIVKVFGQGSMAIVALPSVSRKVSVAALFYVNLSRKIVPAYRNFDIAPTGRPKEYWMARFFNGSPINPHRQATFGQNYVITQDGRKLTYAQFAQEANRRTLSVAPDRITQDMCVDESCVQGVYNLCNKATEVYCAVTGFILTDGLNLEDPADMYGKGCNAFFDKNNDDGCMSLGRSAQKCYYQCEPC